MPCELCGREMDPCGRLRLICWDCWEALNDLEETDEWDDVTEEDVGDGIEKRAQQRAAYDD